MRATGYLRLPVLLVLASTYPRWAGDAEPGFVHELARRLTGRFRVLVLCPHAPGAKRREVMDGVEVIRYRYAPEQLETLVNNGGIVTNLKRARWKFLLVPGFVLGQAWAAWRLLRRERVDVIQAHWLIPQGLIVALLQRLPGRKVPFVVTSHGADLYALKGRGLDALKRFVARRAEAATVVSSAMRERLVSLGVPAAHAHVLPMGVDMRGRFLPDPAVPRARGEILFVGRLVEKKGLRHLLDAMPAVRRLRPGVCLTVAGFGPEENALRAQAEELGLADAVHFLGAVAQSDLPMLYQRASLFVAPFVEAGSGDQEGLGLVLVEAIACGCPVLAGDVSAVRDVIEVDEWIVDVRQTDVLVQRIVQLLTTAPQQLRADILAAREALLERLDWTAVARRYEELLTRGQ